MQLSAFLFEGRTSRDPFPAPLGLEHGQKRDQGIIVQSAVWFNTRGERLGFGDVCKKDLERIAAELKDDYFVVMRPGSVVIPGRPVPKPGKPYTMDDIKSEITLEIMANYAAYVIGRNAMYTIEHDDVYEEKKLRRDGLVFTFVTPNKFKQMIEDLVTFG